MSEAVDVRITGSATIPKEIPLFAGPDLVGGRASYYEQSVGGESADWSRKGDEIVAAKVENVAGRFQESVLQYHRPLIEDGEIEYDFFWKQGETEVHPALDRLTFVLRLDGAALHVMTDGKWDKTGAKPEDVRKIEGSIEVPLKQNDWNRQPDRRRRCRDVFRQRRQGRLSPARADQPAHLRPLPLVGRLRRSRAERRLPRRLARRLACRRGAGVRDVPESEVTLPATTGRSSGQREPISSRFSGGAGGESCGEKTGCRRENS